MEDHLMLLDLAQPLLTAACDATCERPPRGFTDNARSFAFWGAFFIFLTNWFSRPTRQLTRPAPKRIKVFAILGIISATISIILFLLGLAAGTPPLLSWSLFVLALACLALGSARFQQAREDQRLREQWADEDPREFQQSHHVQTPIQGQLDFWHSRFTHITFHTGRALAALAIILFIIAFATSFIN